jgi:hypothetical protein
VDTPRSLSDVDSLIDIIPIATEVFDLIATMSEGSVLPEKDLMTQLAGSFARSVKWDVQICDVHGKGSFFELMSALAPVWEGLTITKAEVRSVTKRTNTVAIIKTVYTTHIQDQHGNVIEGTDGPMEVAVSARFYRGKIAQWHQEFDKDILDHKRLLAKAAMQPADAESAEAETEPAAAETQEGEHEAAASEEENAAAEKEDKAEAEPAAEAETQAEPGVAEEAAAESETAAEPEGAVAESETAAAAEQEEAPAAEEEPAEEETEAEAPEAEAAEMEAEQAAEAEAEVAAEAAAEEEPRAAVEAATDE